MLNPFFKKKRKENKNSRSREEVLKELSIHFCDKCKSIQYFNRGDKECRKCLNYYVLEKKSDRQKGLKIWSVGRKEGEVEEKTRYIY